MHGIADRAIHATTADGLRVEIVNSVTANARFAANQLSTSGEVTDISVSIVAWFGARHATVETDDLTDDGIRSAVGRAEALAKLSPEDPESLPPLIGPQQYQPVRAYFESTARMTAADRAQAALAALAPARAAHDVTAAGYLVTSTRAEALVTKAGMDAYHRSTSANYTLTVRTADRTGSGWAGADDHDWSHIDTKAVVDHAIEKATRSRHPVPIEPGRYTVILEPQAVGDLVQLMLGHLGAREADEGRSAFSKAGGGTKIGDKIVDSRITLFSDPADPQILSRPYDTEGFPLARETWIQDGVLTALAYSRFWAKKETKPFVGDPRYPGFLGFGVLAPLKLAGGPTSIDEMIRNTDRGVLVTRFWYLRPVDPRTILHTGLTRDGTFLIEHGEIARPIKNFRFNDSPLFLLNNVEAIGPSTRLAGTEAGGDVAMPALKAHDFAFTSLSDAV
jgi:predicted Zn-dependent protease